MQISDTPSGPNAPNDANNADVVGADNGNSGNSGNNENGSNEELGTSGASSGALSPLTKWASLTSLKKREQRASLVGSIKSFADAPAPIAAEFIRQIIKLENHLYPVIQSDKRWFFSLASKTEAIQFARDMFVLHSVAADTFEQLIERRGEWSYTDSDELLQRAIAFALYHHGAAIKWSFFRHEPVKPTVWPALHRLFLFAERNGFATAPIHLFDCEAEYSTSAQSLYVRALLLEVLNTGSLTIEQVEIADGWLAAWVSEYLFDTTYLPHAHSLFVDLLAQSGLQLVTGNTAGPSYRYLRKDNLKGQIEAVRNELRAGKPFHGHGAANLFAMEQHVALLTTIEKLYQTLLNASASRIEERTQVSNLFADVHLDFKNVRNAVLGEEITSAFSDGVAGEIASKATSKVTSAVKFGGIDGTDGVELTLEPISSPTDSSPTDADPTTAAAAVSVETKHEFSSDSTRWTRWKIHDISSRGVGLLIDRAAGERIKVGQLLAIKPDGIAHWMIAVIVRKLTQRALGETLLGVEILCYRPLAISLMRYANAQDTTPDPVAPPISALYLPGADSDGKSDILIMPAADFQLKNVFCLTTQTASFRVKINRVLRQGGDWVGLRFEVIGRS